MQRTLERIDLTDPDWTAQATQAAQACEDLPAVEPLPLGEWTGPHVVNLQHWLDLSA